MSSNLDRLISSSVAKSKIEEDEFLGHLESDDAKFDIDAKAKDDQQKQSEEEEVVLLDEEGGGGDFIDDDLGLSSIQEESERIRKQQLAIEEEVRKGRTI